MRPPNLLASAVGVRACAAPGHFIDMLALFVPAWTMFRAWLEDSGTIREEFTVKMNAMLGALSAFFWLGASQYGQCLTRDVAELLPTSERATLGIVAAAFADQFAPLLTLGITASEAADKKVRENMAIPQRLALLVLDKVLPKAHNVKTLPQLDDINVKQRLSDKN